MYRSIELRKACCHIRKVEPLERALAGQRAWITGLRREQSNARAEVPLVDTSDADGRIKFNPLANWTWGDVWHYISANRSTTTRCTTSSSQHRLRALHPGHQPGRGLPRRPLVVGRRGRQGMRPARETDERGKASA